MKTRTEVSAGGVVFRLRDGGGFDAALILTREHRWQLPKGWIDAGESPEQAAIREVREEAGVNAEIVGPLDVIEYQYVSNYDAEPARVRKKVHMFLLRYLDGSTADHDDEVTDARWVDVSEAESLLAFKDEQRMMSMARELLASVASSQPPTANH